MSKPDRYVQSSWEKYQWFEKEIVNNIKKLIRSEVSKRDVEEIILRGKKGWCATKMTQEEGNNRKAKEFTRYPITKSLMHCSESKKENQGGLLTLTKLMKNPSQSKSPSLTLNLFLTLYAGKKDKGVSVSVFPSLCGTPEWNQKWWLHQRSSQLGVLC